MPAWLLRVLHRIGLTNLTNAEVERYASAKRGRPTLTFTSAPLVRLPDRPCIRPEGAKALVTGPGR